MHDVSKINVGHDVLEANRALGMQNRAWLDAKGIRAINVMGAIGSGKTSLIEVAIERLKQEMGIAVMAGDVIAEFDSARLRRCGVQVIPLNTGKECHLDAHLVQHGLEQLNTDGIELLLVENVGNLICPSDFYLGEHLRVIVVSVTEGDDIVAKHPVIFKEADVAIVNKVDLAQLVSADPEKMLRDARVSVPRAFATSVRTGLGMEQWIQLVRETVRSGSREGAQR